MAVVCGAAVFAGPAAAEPAVLAPPAPAPAPPTGLLTIDGVPGRRVTVDTPIPRIIAPAARISSTIYLERCKGDCEIRVGSNDARTNTSSIPPRTSRIGEFANAAGEVGAAADAEWAQIVQCMKEVYSPFAVTVTDVKPTDGGTYHQAVIAGDPRELDLDDNILGIAPLASDCSAIDNVISFTFPGKHPVLDRVLHVCWTAAQESAHAFGLDHEYSFSNGRSACNDPMTYRLDCGGQKFFRNEIATCGEGEPRDCKCGGSQNSHLKLLGVFGAGTPITGRPEVSLSEPAPGATTLGRGIGVRAGAKRGVARVELFVNGFKWNEVPGAAFQARGQPFPSSYSILVPTTLPDSIVEVKAIAYDDLGAAGESPPVTVVKGAPCTSSSTCAHGQRCEDGKCFWDPAVGEVGDTCTYPQFCKSGVCDGTADLQICTQACIPNVADSCPSDLSCIARTTNEGVCFYADSGGCCSASGGSTWWASGGLAALILGLIARRRRR